MESRPTPLLQGFPCEIQIVASDAERDFAAYYGRVYRFVRRRSQSDEDAADLTQTVFLEAARQVEQLKQDSRPLLAWLYTVAQRRLVDGARRRRVRGIPVPLADADPQAADASYGATLASSIRGAIGALPASQREAVVMRLILGMSFAEIARKTGASEAACKMRVVRAVASIRDYLDQEGIGP